MANKSKQDNFYHVSDCFFAFSTAIAITLSVPPNNTEY